MMMTALNRNNASMSMLTLLESMCMYTLKGRCNIDQVRKASCTNMLIVYSLNQDTGTYAVQSSLCANPT